jgi:DNA replication protein DnaC
MINYRHASYLYYIPLTYHHCTLNNFEFLSKYEKRLISFIEETSTKNGLYLFGGFGVGKTHILVSLYRIIIAKIEDSDSDLNINDVFYSSLERIVKESKIKNDEDWQEFLEHICNVKWLFLDDISAILLKDVSADILRTIINSRFEKKLSTCLTANVEIAGLASIGLHSHAISRIHGMCELIHVKGEDRRK